MTLQANIGAGYVRKRQQEDLFNLAFGEYWQNVEKDIVILKMKANLEFSIKRKENVSYVT